MGKPYLDEIKTIAYNLGWMPHNPYWLVCGLSYEDSIKLASADCVELFQRDARSGETKFRGSG